MKRKVVFYSVLVCVYIMSSTYIFAQKTVRILAIGNSFSVDAAESYVDDLAIADSVQLIIANMNIGGCSLETHWKNASSNTAAYSYNKIVNGTSTITKDQNLEDALKDEPWDFISLQQVSYLSGRYDSYYPFLPNLISYVKTLVNNTDVQICLHRTWAYASNSTHSEYGYYDHNQKIMFDSIVSVTKRVAFEAGIDLIIPAGTAIQNGRSSYIGDNFNRDGYHLSYDLGRYTAACTWYEKLTGKAVVGNTYAPEALSQRQIDIAQNAAHLAILEPNKITLMHDSIIVLQDCEGLQISNCIK